MGNVPICQSSFSPHFLILGVPFEGFFYQNSTIIISFLHKLIFIRPKVNYCLAVSQSVSWIFSNLLDFSEFYIDNTVKIVTWISLICRMDLSKLFHGFVKVVQCISRSLPNKTKLTTILKLVEASDLN